MRPIPCLSCPSLCPSLCPVLLSWEGRGGGDDLRYIGSFIPDLGRSADDVASPCLVRVYDDHPVPPARGPGLVIYPSCNFFPFRKPSPTLSLGPGRRVKGAKRSGARRGRGVNRKHSQNRRVVGAHQPRRDRQICPLRGGWSHSRHRMVWGVDRQILVLITVLLWLNRPSHRLKALRTPRAVRCTLPRHQVLPIPVNPHLGAWVVSIGGPNCQSSTSAPARFAGAHVWCRGDPRSREPGEAHNRVLCRSGLCPFAR